MNFFRQGRMYMSLCNRFVSVLALLSLAFLAGCGSSTHSPVPPPSGAFSDADFGGTYTFSISGEDIDAASEASPFLMAGSFTACGCSGGTISGGTVDLMDLSGIGTALSVNNSSGYSISQDGRGTVTLSIATSSGNTSVVLDLVLTSSSHGLVSRFDTGGTGSGTIDLQTSGATLSTTSPYAFSLSGSDLAENSLATVGDFQVGSSGSFTTGILDGNENGTLTVAASLIGSITLGSGTTPGLATLSSAFGNLTFDVYTIDGTHLKLIENDDKALLVGDVFSGSSSTVSQGTLAFEASGLDSSGAPFAAAGLVNSDGSSVLSNGAEDINDDGNVDGTAGTTNPAVPESFTGTFANSPSGTGRVLVNLSGFLGGSAFAAYPSSGGILMMEIDTGVGAGTTVGVAMAQTSTAGLTASQGYGMNVTGFDLTGQTELDEIAEFTTTSSGISGLIDSNDFGVANPGTSNFDGSYTPGSGGVGEATFNSGPLGGFFYYGIDSADLFALGIDSTDVVLGSVQGQTTPTASAAVEVAQRHLSIVKALSAAKKKRVKTN
jgi:hypothetical protein